MKLRTITLLAAACLLLVSATAYADIARPRETPRKPPMKYAINSSMQIVPDSKTYSARLQISEATMKEIMESMNDTTAGSTGGRFNGNALSTIFAGLFLFMSLSFAGVWFARSKSGKFVAPRTAAMILLSMGFVGAAAIVTSANAGPPPSYLWRNLPKNLNDGRSTSGGVDIEIVPEGSGVKLIMPIKKSGNGDD